jgi:uncharacterized coiled-coil DUF342 family protein
MWKDLLVIADKLDESGLYAEANEMDMILSMAAMPGGPVFSKLETLMNESGKDTFTRAEIDKLMEVANQLAELAGMQTYQYLKDEPTYIAESIKALADDIIKLQYRIRAGSKDSRIHNAYVEDIMKLSNSLTIFNRMMAGSRGQEDIQNALRIKEMAADYIDIAQELVREFYQARLGNSNWTQKFSQVMDNWNKIRTKRDETAKTMAEEQQSAEQAGVKFDPRDSKYAPVVKELDTLDAAVRKDAKELMSHYDIMLLADPDGAKALGSQLGNTFQEIKRLSREELRGD